jgi:hypothetical protein
MESREVFCPQHGLLMVASNAPQRNGAAGPVHRFRGGAIKKYYRCPARQCDYKVGAHPWGTAVGHPTDRRGRYLRHAIHELCKLVWNWKVKAEREEMYEFIIEHTVTGHIGDMDAPALLDLLGALEEHPPFRRNKQARAMARSVRRKALLIT